MKRVSFTGFDVVAVTISFIAVLQEKWLLAIWFALVLVLIELYQIHNTIKAAHGIK